MEVVLMPIFSAAAHAIFFWGPEATWIVLGMLPAGALVFYYRGRRKSTAASPIRTRLLIASVALWLFLSAIVWISAMVLGMWGRPW